MEVDRELDRGKQALPPVVTDLPALGEQVLHRPEVGHDRTLKQRGNLWHGLGVAQHVAPHGLGAGVEAVEFRKRRRKPLLWVADPRPGGRVGRGVAIGPASRACLQEVGYVGEVVVDGKPVDPRALGYLAYGGVGGPPRAVQLDRGLHDPASRLALALSPLLHLVLALVLRHFAKHYTKRY